MAKPIKRKKRKSEGGSTFFLILLIILLLVVAYVIYQKKDSLISLKNSLDEQKTEQEKETPIIEETKKDIKVEENTQPEKKDLPNIIIKEVKPKSENKIVKVEEKKEPQKKVETTKSQKNKKSDTSVVLRTTQKKLYFIKYDNSNEPVKLEGVTRTIKYESSPLTQTLNTLFYGPTSSELNKDLFTMIPTDAKIKSINIKNGIAYIDLNQAFAINKYGREGIEAQLKQVVWTAMEFSTVEAIQFLIEGKKVEFLNEGVKIDKPINKSSF